MLRTISVLALLLLAPTPSFAEVLDCPVNANGDLTMELFTKCLLDKRGADSIVTNAIVVGVDKTGKNGFTDEYASPMYNAHSAVPALTAACTPSTTLDTIPAGAFSYKWCASTAMLQLALRDKWLYQQGRWKVIEGGANYACADPAKYAAMPPIVKATVCD